jgi:hypothetical protein
MELGYFGDQLMWEWSNKCRECTNDGPFVHVSRARGDIFPTLAERIVAFVSSNACTLEPSAPREACPDLWRSGDVSLERGMDQ